MSEKIIIVRPDQIVYDGANLSGITDLTTTGNGYPVLKDVVGTVGRIKSIVQGTNTSITDDGNQLTISVTGVTGDYIERDEFNVYTGDTETRLEGIETDLSSITTQKLDKSVFNTYTGDTETRLDTIETNVSGNTTNITNLMTQVDEKIPKVSSGTVDNLPLIDTGGILKDSGYKIADLTGGTSINAFEDIPDVPLYIGNGGKYVVIKGTEDGVEYVDEVRVGTIEIRYKFDTNTDIGTQLDSGYVKLNNTDYSLATEVYIHETSAVGLTIDGALLALKAGDIFIIKDRNSNKFISFNVTGNGTDNGDWWTLPVTFRKSLGTFNDNERVTSGFIYLGVKTYDGLSDTPNDKVGKDGYYVKVDETNNKHVYYDLDSEVNNKLDASGGTVIHYTKYTDVNGNDIGALGNQNTDYLTLLSKSTIEFDSTGFRVKAFDNPQYKGYLLTVLDNGYIGLASKDSEDKSWEDTTANITNITDTNEHTIYNLSIDEDVSKGFYEWSVKGNNPWYRDITLRVYKNGIKVEEETISQDGDWEFSYAAPIVNSGTTGDQYELTIQSDVANYTIHDTGFFKVQSYTSDVTIEWGSLTGNMDNQTDLKDKFATKPDISSEDELTGQMKLAVVSALPSTPDSDTLYFIK